MTVADTDVLVDFLAGRGQGAKRIAQELGAGGLATTSISAVELRSGARSPRQRASIEALLGALPILSFGDDEARLAAELRSRLEAGGRGIGMADYMIAAICLSVDATLLTRNRKHFERVEGLRLSEAAEPG